MLTEVQLSAASRDAVDGSAHDSVSLLLAPTRRVTIRSGVFNLANTILGAGMLGIPAAFAQCGMVVGLLLLVIFAGLSGLGLHLLSSACDLSGRPASFHAVAERAVPGSGVLIDAAIAIKCFGVATSYLIVVGDSVPKALRSFGAPHALLNRRLWTVCAALAVTPLAYLRQIDALRHTSSIALGCILLITVLVVTFAARPVTPFFDACITDGRAPGSLPPCQPDDVVAASDVGSTLSALPVFTFAFTCHQNIVSISNELGPGPTTRRRVLAVILIAEALSLTQ